MSAVANPVQVEAEVAAVTLTRTYQASRERIFVAWTDPKLLAQWFGPGPGFCPQVESDPRLGGSYQIRMTNPAGSVHTAVGSFQEFDPPAKLTMTWRWQENNSADGSTVTIQLRDLGNNTTELTLTHAGLPTEESRANHTKGWTGCLNSLGVFADPDHYTQPAQAPTACA